MGRYPNKMLLLKQTTDVDDEKIREKYDDQDEATIIIWRAIPLIWSDDDDGLDSDDDDKEAALLAELANIRSGLMQKRGKMPRLLQRNGSRWKRLR
jgi:hypothetical protein